MIIMKGNSIEKQKNIRISEVMTVGTKKINYVLTLLLGGRAITIPWMGQLKQIYFLSWRLEIQDQNVGRLVPPHAPPLAFRRPPSLCNPIWAFLHVLLCLFLFLRGTRSSWIGAPLYDLI